MKKLLITIILIASIGVNSNAQRTTFSDTATNCFTPYKKTIDSLKTALNISKYKINKVKYYVAIVDRRPTQIKYLKGWIKRAVK